AAKDFLKRAQGHVPVSDQRSGRLIQSLLRRDLIHSLRVLPRFCLPSMRPGSGREPPPSTFRQLSRANRVNRALEGIADFLFNPLSQCADLPCFTDIPRTPPSSTVIIMRFTSPSRAA